MAAHRMEVVVRGPLWPALLVDLQEFDVETRSDGLTMVAGEFDQSRLLGLLEMFDGLNIEVVSMNREDPPAARGRIGDVS